MKTTDILSIKKKEKRLLKEMLLLFMGREYSERNSVHFQSIKVDRETSETRPVFKNLSAWPDSEHFHKVIKLPRDKGKFETSRAPDILAFNP